MQFEEVMYYLRKGEKARRNIWDVFDYIYLGENDYGSATICDCTSHIRELGNADILAEDWEIV